MADQGQQQPQRNDQPQQQQGASIQQLTQMAQRLGDLGRQGGPFRQVFITAREVKQQQMALKTSLESVFAIINRLRQPIQGLDELRQALEQGEVNQYESIRRLDQLLRESPTPEEINQLIEQLREIAQQNGIRPEDLGNQFPPAPGFSQNALPANMPRGGPPANRGNRGNWYGADEDEEENQGGGRQPKSKKRGGYGWSGKKGVEVRSSIRTTRRSKAKKGKKTPSKKRTKKRSSGNKRSMKSRRGGIGFTDPALPAALAKDKALAEDKVIIKKIDTPYYGKITEGELKTTIEKYVDDEQGRLQLLNELDQGTFPEYKAFVEKTLENDLKTLDDEALNSRRKESLPVSYDYTRLIDAELERRKRKRRRWW